MRPIDLELLVKRHIDEVRAGRPAEDDRIELKQTWPDPKDPRRARQMAGAANALRGEPLIYILGCAEDGTTHPLTQEEPESWYGQIAACFDSPAPRLAVHRNVVLSDSAGDSVVALLFETDTFPYVMQVDGKTDRREVPIRVGAGTRSANRSQLLSILAPTIRTPACEMVQASVTARLSHLPEATDYRGEHTPARTTLEYRLKCSFLVAHVGTAPVSVLLRKTRGRMRFDEIQTEFVGEAKFNGSLREGPQPTHGISFHPGVATVMGPGIMTAYLNVEQTVRSEKNEGLVNRANMVRNCSEAVAEIQLHFIGASNPVNIFARLPVVKDRHIGGTVEAWGQSWNMADETDN